MISGANLFLRTKSIITGNESWQSLVDRICKPQPLSAPERFFA
jgi:hypothetical protein